MSSSIFVQPSQSSTEVEGSDIEKLTFAVLQNFGLMVLGVPKP